MTTQTVSAWPLRLRQFTIAALAALKDNAIRVPLLVFLALRLVTGIAAVISVNNAPAAPPDWLWLNSSGQTYNQTMPLDGPLAALIAPWNKYDTAWYAKIAIQGYRAGDPAIVFPPLYPTLIRIVTTFLTPGNDVLAALLISNVVCLIAFVLLFQLARLELGDDRAATRALIYLAAFPTAYYLVGGYTESLFLALTLGAFLTAFRKQWWLTGALAALAALTRLQGAILCIPLAWIAYVQLRESGLRAILARVPAAVGGAVGLLSYLAYLAINNLGSFETAYRTEWRLTTRLPFDAIQDFLTRYGLGQTFSFENDNALALLFIVALGLLVTWKLRPAYALYLWASLGLILLRYHQGPQFESMIRYTLLFFPCFLVAGKLFSYGWLVGAYVAGCGQWMLTLLDRFIHWNWVA